MMGVSLAQLAAAPPGAAVGSGVLQHADADQRIFIGGLPYYLTEEQCRWGNDACLSGTNGLVARLDGWRCPLWAGAHLRPAATHPARPRLRLLRELLPSFGAIKTFDLVMNPETGQNKG